MSQEGRCLIFILNTDILVITTPFSLIIKADVQYIFEKPQTGYFGYEVPASCNLITFMCFCSLEASPQIHVTLMVGGGGIKHHLVCCVLPRLAGGWAGRQGVCSMPCLIPGE